MKKLTYRKIVKMSAIYDVVMTFPFVFPVVALWHINLITDIHRQYAFGGTVDEFLPLHLFFVNLMASVVLIWSAIRIYKPAPILGLYDSFARFLFSFNMLYYLLIHDVTSILWVMFIPELTWGLIQFFGYLSAKNKVPHE